MYQVYETTTGRTVWTAPTESRAERVVDCLNETARYTRTRERFDVRFAVPVTVMA